METAPDFGTQNQPLGGPAVFLGDGFQGQVLGGTDGVGPSSGTFKIGAGKEFAKKAHAKKLKRHHYHKGA